VTFRKPKRSSTERGYGPEHRRLRAALLPTAHFRPCPLCGRQMLPGQSLHLDHARPLRLGGTLADCRIVHGQCNERAGAELGRDLAAAGYRRRQRQGIPARRSREW
jgi:hypothetical protein